MVLSRRANEALLGDNGSINPEQIAVDLGLIDESFLMTDDWILVNGHDGLTSRKLMEYTESVAMPTPD